MSVSAPLSQPCDGFFSFSLHFMSRICSNVSDCHGGSLGKGRPPRSDVKKLLNRAHADTKVRSVCVRSWTCSSVPAARTHTHTHRSTLHRHPTRTRLLSNLYYQKLINGPGPCVGGENGEKQLFQGTVTFLTPTCLLSNGTLSALPTAALADSVFNATRL